MKITHKHTHAQRDIVFEAVAFLRTIKCSMCDLCCPCQCAECVTGSQECGANLVRPNS